MLQFKITFADKPNSCSDYLEIKERLLKLLQSQDFSEFDITSKEIDVEYIDPYDYDSRY